MTEVINHNARANWLRAAVLGAIDGIVSIAGLVVGVASATNSKSVILIAGLAGILAGALSMAVGEFVSVSTQKDIEERHHEKTAAPDEGGEFTNPWHAALASALSFVAGSIIPMVAVLLPLGEATIPATFLSVVLALAITSYWSAVLSDTGRLKVVARVTIGGMIAMVVTFGVGSIFSV